MDKFKPGDQVTVTYPAEVVRLRKNAVCVVVGKTDNFPGYEIWVPREATVTLRVGKGALVRPVKAG